MKKYLLIVLLLVFTSVAHANLIIYGGVNRSGEIKGDITTKDVEDSYTVGLEANFSLNRSTRGNLELGIGAKYYYKLEFVDEGEEVDLGPMLPLYASIKYTYGFDGILTFFIQGKIGNNYINEFEDDSDTNTGPTTKGKLFTGIGAGVEVGNLVIGAAYEISSFEVEYEGSSDVDKINYSKLSLTVGYKLRIN